MTTSIAIFIVFLLVAIIVVIISEVIMSIEESDYD